jgi:SnoaL-like polyketide cyclase
MVRRAFPDLRFVLDLVVSDGKCLAGRWTMTGTNTGSIDLFGVPPSDRPVTMTAQAVVRGGDGLFVEVWTRRTCPACLPTRAPDATTADAARRPLQRLALQTPTAVSPRRRTAADSRTRMARRAHIR